MYIYDYRLSDVTSNLIKFIKNRDYQLIFLNENSFAIKNKDNLFLTAFPNGVITFFNKNCELLERFYIIDNVTLEVMNKIVKNKTYVDSKNRIIKQVKLTTFKNKLKVLLGNYVLTPSFLPPASVEYNKQQIVYKSLEETLYLNTKDAKRIIYFCVYGNEKYYSMFEMALNSLVKFGKYSGDILIKADDHLMVNDILSRNHIENKIYLSQFKEELGLFNRYDLHEDFLKKYDSIVYLDSDVLTISPLTEEFWNCISQGDISIYSELTDQKIIHTSTYKWFGFKHIVDNSNFEKFNLFNSGFFSINCLDKLRVAFQNILDYRIFCREYGDQPFFNMVFYNNDIKVSSLLPNCHLGFARCEFEFYKSLNEENIFVHYNSGVGNLSKLELIKSGYKYLLENNE